MFLDLMWEDKRGPNGVYVVCLYAYSAEMS